LGYKLSWEPKGFFIRYYGTVTSADIMLAMREIHSSKQFDSIRYGVSEYSQVDRYDVTPSQIVVHAAHWNGASYSNPRIVLASVTDKQNIIDVLKSIEVSILRRKLCSTLDEARAWIKHEGHVDAILE